jgi:hypothetical protein
MNNSITTYEALLEEKLRLQKQLEEQKMQFKKDFTTFKSQLEEQLEPATNLLHTVGKFTGQNGAKPVLNFGLGLGLDMLLRNTLLKKAGFITKLAAPFLLRTVTNTFSNDKGPSLLQKIGNLFKKKDKLAKV